MSNMNKPKSWTKIPSDVLVMCLVIAVFLFAMVYGDKIIFHAEHAMSFVRGEIQ